jgi:hypothetical protein
MPRDGAQNYSVPGGTDGVPDTPVASTPYNGFLRDLEQDLNTPRPILAGGTGATNARDAMINLSGEVANQGPITNYADYPFLPGTFYSLIGATNAPPSSGNATEIFVGICYGQPGISLQLECRGQITHTKYFRSQNAGVWSAWIAQVSSQVDADAMYVNVTGDLMTGPLAVSYAATPGNGGIVFGNANQYIYLDGTTAPATPQFSLSAPLNIPSSTAPSHAVRLDVMQAADAALQTTLQNNINAKADASAIPQPASVAEFRANTAPGKMLTPGAVWAAAGIVGVAQSGQIDFAQGFDFVIPGGNIYNPINAKQGQKGCIYNYGTITYWGTAWKFPNAGVKPVHSGGSDLISYWVYSSDFIFCVYSPNFG